jgi:protein gp37
MRLAATRLRNHPKYEGLAVYRDGQPRWTKKTRLWEPELEAPLRLRKPSRIFVADMGDLLYEGVTDADILRVFDVIRQCPRHTFLILTKRAERMRDLCTRMRFDGCANGGAGRMWLADDADGPGYRIMGGNGCTGMPWVHLGVSVEDQATADERIPHLMRTPAAVRFVSAEPLLGPVDLDLYDIGKRDADGRLVDWVIVGGESGPGARPCQTDWVISLLDQCRDAKVPFFFKQLGSNARDAVGRRWLLNDRKGADMAEWPEPWRVREFPA